ncbi:hypothetical protein Q7P36_007360 [Cladosporium allicinum]
MTQTNDVSIAKLDAWVDIENQIQTPRKTHQNHQLDMDFNQTDTLPPTPRQDRPEPPQKSLLQWIKKRLPASTSEHKAPTQSKTEIEQTQLIVANSIDTDEVENVRILKAREQKPFDPVQTTFPVAFRRDPGRPEPLKHAGQVLFLCFDRVSRGQYSVRVPCFRPTRYRTPLQLKQANKKGHAEAIPPREKVVESDDHMIERMRETIESELGKWTRFVPYFGVIGAEIVEFRFRPHCCVQNRQPIAIGDRKDIEKTLKEYNHAKRLLTQLNATEGPDRCSLPRHFRECPASQDRLIPCTFDGKGWGKGKKCITESNVWHDGSLCKDEECIEWQMEFAERVGIDGIEAFKRLPEWLRRPRDINSWVLGKFNCWPLSQWMKNQHLIYDLIKNSEDIEIPQQDQKDDTRRGIRFKVGWDFDRMRAKLPGQLALIVTAGSVVWLSVILWATETGDLSTALAIGSFLIGFSALLFDHFPRPE